jgi:outer membrane protein assembly factor BamD
MKSERSRDPFERNRSEVGTTTRSRAVLLRLPAVGIAAVLLAWAAIGCSSAPAYQGMDAPQIFELAEQAMEDEDWNDAIDAFERLISAHPGFPRLDEARMGLARAHFEKGEYVTAAAEYERFIIRYPSHGRVAEASLGICRSYAALSPHAQRDQEYTARARDACRQTRDEFQGMNVAEEAEEIRREMVERLAESEFLAGRFYQRRDFHDSAIIYFQDVVDFFPETTWAPRAFLAMYRSYRAIGWHEEAEETRDRLLFLYPDSQAAAELRAEQDGAARADGAPESGDGG